MPGLVPGIHDLFFLDGLRWAIMLGMGWNVS